MGGGSSLFADILTEEPVNTLLSSEIQNLKYEEFLKILKELNVFTKNCLDSDGNQLVFAVKKDTDSTFFWKATVQIACVKVDPRINKVLTYRCLSLSEFLKVFKTLQCQISAAEQSKSNMSIANFLDIYDKANFDSSNECCICLERQQERTLPCAHSYCKACIEEWNETHDTCPICREKLESTDDAWVISEVPKADEISKEIQENLMELTEDKSSPCAAS